MNIAFLSIGDELLIGKTINTNASWLGEQLSAVGFSIHSVETIPDNRKDILDSLNRLVAENSVVIITGGLGPTNDDITKHVLCEFFNTSLAFNQQAYDGMARYVVSRNQEINDKNKTQAQFPQGATFLPNPCGTASGMWFEKDSCVIVSLPGVPYEMKAIMTQTVIPLLKKKFSLPAIYHRHALVTNIAEAKLSEIISEWENNLPAQIHLAYLPSAGIVKLRMSCVADNLEKAKELVAVEELKLRKIINPYIFGFDDDTIEGNIGKLLLKYNETISSAESCTGGNIAHLLTRIAGCSAYYMGGIVSYDNSVKIKELQVKQSVIESYGVVSKEVVETMSQSVRKNLNTTYGVATSGIAGPSGGSEEKPVGTVWIAVASSKQTIAHKYSFGNNSREHNIEKATIAALVMLQQLILKEHNESL